jgi:spore coat protein U-like protein
VTAIAFGPYDPTATTALDASGGMQFKCVKGTSYKTFITGTRSMNGGGDTLTFSLFTDSGRSTTFPADNSAGGTTATNNTSVTTSIYGRIAAGQNVGVNAYSGSVTATVEY